MKFEIKTFRDIRRYQKFIEFLISKICFNRFVREFIHDITKKNIEFDDIIEDFRIQRAIFEVFQKTTKNYIIFVLSNKYIISLHYFDLIIEIVNFFYNKCEFVNNTRQTCDNSN